eukprot:1804805-Rhodomonas_salina.4
MRATGLRASYAMSGTDIGYGAGQGGCYWHVLYGALLCAYVNLASCTPKSTARLIKAASSVISCIML